MRAYIEIPDTLLTTLQEQARAAHRSPRAHLEWLIQQTLQTTRPEQVSLQERVERLEQRARLCPAL
jgi:hypothetical protein